MDVHSVEPILGSIPDRPELSLSTLLGLVLAGDLVNRFSIDKFFEAMLLFVPGSARVEP